MYSPSSNPWNWARPDSLVVIVWLYRTAVEFWVVVRVPLLSSTFAPPENGPPVISITCTEICPPESESDFVGIGCGGKYTLNCADDRIGKAAHRSASTATIRGTQGPWVYFLMLEPASRTEVNLTSGPPLSPDCASLSTVS